MSAQMLFNSCVFSHLRLTKSTGMVSYCNPADTQQCSCSIRTSAHAAHQKDIPLCFADEDGQTLPLSLCLQQKTRIAGSPHHHHGRVQLPSQQLRSHKSRWAPGTNVRSDWATTLIDDQIWCQPLPWFGGGMAIWGYCLTAEEILR